MNTGKLPKESKYGINISWASSDEKVIESKTGFITQPDSKSSDKTVILTALITKGKASVEKKIDIKKKDNYQTIQKKIGKYLEFNISRILLKYLQNKINLKKNDSRKETWNCSRNPEDGLINFFKKREDVHNLIRACKNKSFGAFCYLKEKKIIIMETSIKKNKKYEGIIPGRITQIYKNGNIDCLCKNGPITIKKIYYKNKIMTPSKIIKSTRDTLLND